MCSIAGILYKHGKRPAHLKMTTGEALTEILDGTVHRGPDSCGWGLYKEPRPGITRLRFLVSEGNGREEDIARIKKTLDEQGAEFVDDDPLGCSYGVSVKYGGDIQQFCYAVGRASKLISVGSSLDILKDVGKPYENAPRYNIQEFDGDHGIGHTRLATESGVHPDTAHPFVAPGFSDVAAVHNGQITNYWIMRRRLERQGMEFQTENDTELIAVYLAYKLSQGTSLEEALKTSLADLDGTYSFLVATNDSIGYAKDKLAAKPLVTYEDDEMVAVASEEVGLNRLFPGQALDTTEPAPLTYGLWTRA